MYKLTKTIIALLAISLAFTSCKKEEEAEPELNNQVLYNETTTTLSGARQLNYGTGSWHAGYNVDITLVSTDYENTSDYGTRIYFELASSSSTLAPGTYTYFANESSTNVMPTGRFTGSSDIFTKASSTSTSTTDDIKSGTLTVTQDGSTYTITYTGTTNNGKNLEFHYNGTLPTSGYGSTSRLAKKNKG